MYILAAHKFIHALENEYNYFLNTMVSLGNQKGADKLAPIIQWPLRSIKKGASKLTPMYHHLVYGRFDKFEL